MTYATFAKTHPRPHCWACGTADRQRAHIGAGSGTMRREEDVRAVCLLCLRCHSCHRHNAGDAVKFNGVLYPRLTDANMLWLKAERDVIDWEYLKRVWRALNLPEPEPPAAWYLEQYAMRHPWDHLKGDE
jgi:hypothetical protein